MRASINPQPTRKLCCRAGSIEPIVFSLLALLLSMLSLTLAPIGSVEGMTQRPEKIGPRNKSDPWMKYEINNISYEVALEWLMGEEIGSNSKRVLFVYLEPEHFNKDDLLLVFGHIASKIPQPTTLNVTLLIDRDSLKKRVAAYAGWMMSNETPYTRLTMKSDTCCPEHFNGAQFDRYPDQGKFVICADGRANEITVDYRPTNRN